MTSEGSDRHGEFAAAIMDLCRQSGPDKSICPSEVARRVVGENGNWRKMMPAVRDVAANLQAAGNIDVLQNGERVELRSVKGPVRLRLRQRSEQ